MSVKLLDLDSQRRKAILNAALKEFSLRGFDNASTNVISKEAGISKALMFHYVGSKQELFLFVYDYFTNLLNKEYFMKMDYTKKDIFERLRQSYILQIELLKQYPWIYEVKNLPTKTNSLDVNRELEKINRKQQNTCYNQTFGAIFNMIDESKFRTELDISKCKQIIFWSYTGFTNGILDDIKNSDTVLDFDFLVNKLDEYLEELRKLFYR